MNNQQNPQNMPEDQNEQTPENFPEGQRAPRQKNEKNDLFSKALNAYDGYKEAGGLKGMARSAIDDKKNELKDKAREKIDAKKDQLKSKAMDKLPDPIKKKKEALDAKKQNIQQKVNNAKDKANNLKNKPNELKQKANEQAFRKGIKYATDAVAPGAGTAVEKGLDTAKFKPALEAAKNASNPLSAIKEGTKKVIEILVKTKVRNSLLKGALMASVYIIVILIIISTVSGIGSAFNYTQGDNEGKIGLEAVSEEYTEFYKAVEKYGTANKIMVIAAMTAEADNDSFDNDSGISDTVESCTEEELDSGECFTEIEDNITKHSKSKIKKYIKKVNSAIQDSGGDISEGDYEDIQNTGSKFFRWLYNDFVEDYYKDSINTKTKEKSKKEIVQSIYILYKELYSDACVESNSAGGYDTSCDFNLTTVQVMDGSNTKVLDEISLKDYILGVTLAEIDNWGDDENTFKAFAIVAKTYTLNRSGYDSSTKKIKIRSCTMDQVWCDINSGCNMYDYSGYHATYPKSYNGISADSWTYKAPLSTERKNKWSQWYDEVYQFLYLDRNKYKGPITTLSHNPIGYYNTQQEYWHQQSLSGKDFTQVFAGTPEEEYFHFDSKAGEDLGLYDLNNYCQKISNGSTVAGKYIYYSQLEEPWSSMKHGCGSGATFSSKGCFQTSSAMVLSSLLGREITPKDTNEFTSNNKAGSCTDGTSYYTHFSSIANHYNINVTSISNKTTTSAKRMLEELEKGNLITQILACDYVSDICPTAFGGHGIVIVPGTKDGFVTVLDPAYPEKKSWEVTAEEATGNNTQGSFYVWSLNDKTAVSNDIAPNSSNLIVAGGLNKACPYDGPTGGEGLVANGNFMMRTSRPLRSNSFFYDQETGHGADGTLEGECAWYATGRAKEIVSTLGTGTWTDNPNGGEFCSSSDASKFQTSNDYTKPRPGAIVSWGDGSYGHVGIIEKVEGNTVTLSEAAIAFGPLESFGYSSAQDAWNAFDRAASDGDARKNYCEKDGSGCIIIDEHSIDEMKNLYGMSFQCYIYLDSPK